MAVKDYYAILGIARDESSRGIRKAFRDLARRHHPDLAGPSGTPAFREVEEAYRVLSDPEMRRNYDAGSSGAVRVQIRDAPGPRLRPTRPAPRQTFPSVPLLARADPIRPRADALLDRLLRNFTGLGIPKWEAPEPLFCDISLSAEEARRGGVLPIRLPARRPCPTCHGTGHGSLFPCRACGAEGHLDEELVVPIQLPPGVRSGMRIDVPLDRWGIRNLWLRVRLGVE